MLKCSISRGISSRISSGGIPRSRDYPRDHTFSLFMPTFLHVRVDLLNVSITSGERTNIVPTDLFWTNLFTVGPGGTLPANSTGNSMGSGNLTAITEGMYECTALKFAKEQVSIGLVATYTFGIIITAVIMLIVRGKDSMNL